MEKSRAVTGYAGNYHWRVLELMRGYGLIIYEGWYVGYLYL